MAELGNTLGTWEQFFRVGNMGTTRGLGTIGNISKSGILKLGTIGNSWEQLGKFSELNCKPLRISQCRWGLVLYYECTGYCEWYISCFCTESSGHPQRAGLATARLGTVGNTWEQPDLDGMRVVSADRARARARARGARVARASADDGAPTLHFSALPFFHALSSRNCRWRCIRHDRNGVGRPTVGRHSLQNGAYRRHPYLDAFSLLRVKRHAAVLFLCCCVRADGHWGVRAG